MRLDLLLQISNHVPETKEVASISERSPIFEQTMIRDDVPAVLDKNLNQSIFSWRQFEWTLIYEREASVKIYGQRADAYSGLASGCAQIVSYRAAGAHQKVIDLEGLNKVIVGTKSQEVHLVGGVRSPRQHDHWQAR